MKNDFRLSLIIPCYNEEANIQKGVLDKIGNYTKNNDNFIEVLIVDDGSKDSSKTIIKEKYIKQFPKFQLIENQHLGKAFAIIRGLHEARGNYAMFSDIDLATPIEEADKLIIEAQKGADIVVGSRSSQREGAPFLRKVMSFGAVHIKNIFLGLNNVKDTQCGFKLFERKKTLALISRLRVFQTKTEKRLKGSSVSAGFDLELLFVATKMKLKIKEVPVAWRHVETKNVHFVNDTFETFRDIFQIRVNDFKGYYHTQQE